LQAINDHRRHAGGRGHIDIIGSHSVIQGDAGNQISVPNDTGLEQGDFLFVWRIGLEAIAVSIHFAA
jgi:hypothetical protein